MKIKKQLNEIAMPKADAIELCVRLGNRFVEHFHKLYLEDVTSSSFHHHTSEMQAWLNTVRKVTLKHNTNPLTAINLLD